MPFLVSDTSVIIDLDRGDLLDTAFGLDDSFVVPDILFPLQTRTRSRLRLEAARPWYRHRNAGRQRGQPRRPTGPRQPTALVRRHLGFRVGSRTAMDAFDRRRRFARGCRSRGSNRSWGSLDRRPYRNSRPVRRGDAPCWRRSKSAAYPRCRLPRAEVDRRLKRYLIT